MVKAASEDQLSAVCAAFRLERGRAHFVSTLCDRLFADARHLHGLTKTSRPLLQFAAILHEARPTTGTVRRAVPELAPAERRIVVRALKWHALDSAPEALGEGRRPPRDEALRQVALRIAAILRVATGLDRSRTQGARILALLDDGEAVDIAIPNSYGAAENAAAALARADLWNAVMLRPIRSVDVCDGAAPASALILPSHPLAEALRRVLVSQLEQWMTRTYGLRYDADIEYVHEMRVALRRMRAALGLFRKAFDGGPAALKGELSWFSGELGLVRDLDVFTEFLHGYAAERPGEQQPFVEKLIRSVQRKRRREYRKALGLFESDRYRAFRETYGSAARRPAGSDGALVPLTASGQRPISREAPRLLRRRLKKALKYSRRLERYTPEEQHLLRIQCKRLRYAAEFLADVYPGGLREIIEPMEAVQDGLGDVHDCDVYTDRVTRFLRRQRSDADAAGAAATLLAHLLERREQRLRSAAAVWRSFNAKKTQRRVAAVIKSPRKG